jgi:hypothetical protein
MVRVDGTHWSFRMEAIHTDMLGAIPEFSEAR